MGRKQGLTEQQLLDLSSFENSPAFSEVEKLVLHYTVAMTETPVVVSDALFAALQKQFTPRQMVELTSAIAWENYRARFDHAFGIESEGFSAGAVCPMPARNRNAQMEVRKEIAHVGHRDSGSSADANPTKKCNVN